MPLYSGFPGSHAWGLDNAIHTMDTPRLTIPYKSLWKKRMPRMQRLILNAASRGKYYDHGLKGWDRTQEEKLF